MADNDVVCASLGLWGRHSPEEYLIVLAAMIVVSFVWLAAGAQKRFRRSESSSAKGVKDVRAGAGRENKTGSLVSIAAALGGADNIYDVGCSDTRLRVRVNSGELVDRRRLKATGAVGVLAKNREVHVFYDEHAGRICSELKDYLDRLKGDENKKKSEECRFERVLKKVYTPVEGDVVPLSDIYHVQDVGDGYIGGFAVRAARGEVRAPFDCEAGYSEAGENEIICTAPDGCEARIRLYSGSGAGVSAAGSFRNGESVRKGRLLLEYNYDELVACGEPVHAVILVRYAVSRPAAGKAESERAGEVFLKVYAKENVNYEHVACMLVQ